MNKKILLVGTVSDVAKTLNKELQVVLKALNIFDHIDIFLVESDSNDQTIKILNEIKSQNHNFNFITLGQLRQRYPNRLRRIAHCRNVYVDYIRNFYQISKWNYVAVADLDGMNFRLNKKGIMSCFDTKVIWDGIMANQKFGYYDVFALRAENWVEKDCFEEVNHLKKTLIAPRVHKNTIINFILNFHHFDKIRRLCIYDKMKILRRNIGLIEVTSAFGGFALYNPKVFLHTKYSCINGLESEHVYLHRSATEKEFKFYINPRLINNYFNPYNLNRFFFIRLAREVKKFIEPNKISAQ